MSKKQCNCEVEVQVHCNSCNQHLGCADCETWEENSLQVDDVDYCHECGKKTLVHRFENFIKTIDKEDKVYIQDAITFFLESEEIKDEDNNIKDFLASQISQEVYLEL